MEKQLVPFICHYIIYSLDFLLILTSFILLIVEATTPYSYLAVFRPVKLLRYVHMHIHTHTIGFNSLRAFK